MWRVVTYLPSRPAKGPLLTEKVISIVGSLIFTKGQRLGSIRCAKRISYVDVLDTGNADDISYTRAVNIAPCKSVDLGGLLLFCCGSLTLLCENRTR